MSLYDRSNVKSQTRIGDSLLSKTKNIICILLIIGFTLGILSSALYHYNLEVEGYSGIRLPDTTKLIFFFNSNLPFYNFVYEGFYNYYGEEFINFNNLITIASPFISIKIFLFLFFIRLCKSNIKILTTYLNFYVFYCLYQSIVINFLLYEEKIKLKYILDDGEFSFIWTIINIPSLFGNWIPVHVFVLDILRYLPGVNISVSYVITAVIYGTMAFFLHRSMQAAEAL